MYAAPVGAFGAMAFTIGKYGIGSLVNLGGLVATFYVTSLLFVIVVLGLVARPRASRCWGLVRYIKDELLPRAGHVQLRKRHALADGEARAGRLPQADRGPGRADGLSCSTSTAPASTCRWRRSSSPRPAASSSRSATQLALMAVAIVSSKGAAGVTGSGFVTLAATLSVVPSVPVAGMALDPRGRPVHERMPGADQLRR